MSSKFKNKYRNESSRLPNWDYRNNAAYFITICTKDREDYFGEIKNGKMQFSPAGAIAHVLWDDIRNRIDQVRLGEFVIMPNHVHGILIIDGNFHSGGGDLAAIHRDVGDGRGGADNRGDVANNRGGVADNNRRDVACNVPSMKNIYNSNNSNNSNNPKYQQMSAISPKSNSVSTIIRSYKSAVTKYCNRLEVPVVWQSRFYDNIIRNEESFQHISNYIRNNPSNWKNDQLFKDF